MLDAPLRETIVSFKKHQIAIGLPPKRACLLHSANWVSPKIKVRQPVAICCQKGGNQTTNSLFRIAATDP